MMCTHTKHEYQMMTPAREFADHFLLQQFQNKWKRCVRRGLDIFDKVMNTFWREVSS